MQKPFESKLPFNSHALIELYVLGPSTVFDAHIADLSNVDVQTYDGLTVEFAKRVGAGVILRGIRDTVDLHAELEIALTNRIIGDIETVFLMTDRQHILTSSALIRQIVEIGEYDADHLSRLVPLDVARSLEERLGRSDKPKHYCEPENML